MLRDKSFDEIDAFESLFLLQRVCLFVCLFNSYIVSLFRENMRRIIYNDVSCHLCTIKARKWWSFNFKSSQTISLTHSLQIVEGDFSDQKIFVVRNRFTFVLIVSFLICVRFVVFVSSNSLCRLQNDQVFLSNDLKTIMSFQIELFDFFLTFEVFISCSTRARESDI